MIKILQKLLKEPLVGFLLLGLLLYLYYANVNTNDASIESKEEISVSANELEKIQDEYTKQYKKKMSQEELKLYRENVYRKKVLLEESIRLGLHKNDALVAKRLIEKMAFILLGSVEYKEPSEEELHEYYLKNIEDYSEVEHVTFKHIYFSSAKNNMNELYEMMHLSETPLEDINKLGDSFDGENIYENISYAEVQKKFGKYFASKLFKLKKGVWHKEIHSKYGIHLVYISSKQSSNAYKFDEVEDRVYSDYLAQRRDETIAKAYKNILLNYTMSRD